MKDEDLEFINKSAGKKFEKAILSVSSKCTTDKNEVEKAIKDFSPVDGWISLQSTPAFRIKDSSFDTKGEYILAGECLNNQRQSLSVRYTGDEWVLVTSFENENGEELIKGASKQLSKLGENIFLTYDVYYKNDCELGCRPYVSAFTGFSEGER